jgi:acyl-CoA synthetase (AMP-forming)/AMP-acid ligase II
MPHPHLAVERSPAGYGYEHAMSVYEGWSRAGWRAHTPGTGDIEAHVAGLGDATIHELAAASAARVPDRVALDVDGQQVTHATLDAGAARVASWLARRLAPGGRVLIAARSSPGFVRCYLGALRAGAVVVLANPGCAAAELAHLVTDSGARIAFTDGGPARVLAGLPGPPLIADVAEVPPVRASRGTGAPVRPGSVALLAYTSGTTGRPKAVPLTHRQLLLSIRPAMAAWRWHEDDVLAHALPLFHQHGLGGLHAVLIAGGTARLASRFTAAGLAETVRRHRASVLFAVPTMYHALLDELGTPGRPPLASVRLAVCGSAPLSPLLAERLPVLLGHPPLVRYGLTETGLNVSHLCHDVRAGTVGVPLPGVMARIWSQDEEAPRGTDGEIQVRGAHVFGGYANDPAATAAAFTGDGWFRTGDIGRVDPRTGHLEIRGRIKELIITGGLNVYPREVELVLESHPAVAEAAVAGLPHEYWGEQVTAWVVPRPGVAFDEGALIAHVRAALAGYKTPKRVYELAALPRNQVGKVVRTALTVPENP